MRHEPHGDNLGISTNELICTLVSRVDAPNSLFSLLALLTEVAVELPVHRQYLMAATLHDAAQMIEQRPEVRDWADRLGLTVRRCKCRR
jgi:hypothetical protein